MNERFSTHHKFLEDIDKESWNNFNAELMRQEYYTTFTRSIAKNQKVRLIDVPSWVRTCVIKFMPWFTHENFDSNKWPALPELEHA